MLINAIFEYKQESMKCEYDYDSFVLLTEDEWKM